MFQVVKLNGEEIVSSGLTEYQAKELASLLGADGETYYITLE